MRILLAEDEVKTAEYVKRGLTEAGYAVDLAFEGEEALWLSENNPYDAIILDVMMPGRDGFSIVRQLRRKGIGTPVLFLTARCDVADRIKGLDAGGDDYLVKPFSISELLARVRALLRRRRPDATTRITIGDLELDLISHQARRGNLEISLSNREFALLEFLMISSPRPVSKTAIVEHVWDQNFDSQTNVVNVYVKYLRSKIDLPGYKPLIHTVRGIGFVLRDE
jgi:two-component system copper resistance phosphate regulon response regulator CusR